MKDFEEATRLLDDLQKKIDTIKSLVEHKKAEYRKETQKIKESGDELEKIISEKAELETILNNCSIDICQYKLAFEEIKKRHSGTIQDQISDELFHFFLSFRKDYRLSAIEDHQEVIDKHGFCWWGKFYQKRIKGGEYENLSPFEESINVDDKSNVAWQLKEKVNQRIGNGKNVYLYVYCPNPPDICLYVCNVIDFCYGSLKIPYEDKLLTPPECAHVPKYYFHKREKNCSSCKKIDTTKCKLNFKCNFWFKIDEIIELTDIENEFLNLTNCFTKDIVNLAVPILYPLLVTQKQDRDHFPHKVAPLKCPDDFEVAIPKGEKGHTRYEKVCSFFKGLNKYCGSVIRHVEARRGARFEDGFKIQRGDQNDEILMILPADYSSAGRPYRYAVYLHEETTSSQKSMVENMIENYLANLKR